MATIAEMFVDIGADATQFEKETNQMQKEMQGLQKEMSGMAASMGTSSAQMGRDWQTMSQEMKTAFQGAQEKLKPFKQAQQEVQYEFFKMSQSMKDYTGTNAQFMAEVEAAGKRHKKATEQMMINNDMLKMNFVQNVGTMLARSGQSEKIAANFERMNNPLYSVNNGLLKITGALEGVARAGMPAVLALKLLGPTANMKELNDMVMLISRGLMRFQMVALAAGIASALMFAKLHSSAKENIPGYTGALEEMSAALSLAFRPMVEIFAAVIMKVAEFITKISVMAANFNEAHPILAKIIQGFLLLIPLLTLILSPLAIGIGLWAGMQAAFASLWPLIGPLVTGLGAMMGTVLIVAAAIAVLTAALYLLWTRNETFREGVINAWNAIKSAAVAIWNAIYTNAIKPAIDAIVKFVTEQMNKIKAFWDQNGQMIMQAAKNVWNVISTVIKAVMVAIGAVMSVAWPIIKALIISTWEAIKLTIQGAINVILGIIKFFAALFTGDWGAMWAAVKQIIVGVAQFILGFVQLNFIGGMVKGITAFAKTFGNVIKGAWDDVARFFTNGVKGVKDTVATGFNAVVDFITGLGKSFFNAGKGLVEQMANGIKNSVGKVLDEMKDLAQKARDFLPFSPAKEGPLSDLNKLDFGGPIADSINGAVPKVQSLMGNMLRMPNIGGPSNIAAAGGDTYEVQVTLHADDINQMQSIYDFFDTFKQTKRARG